MAIAVRRDDALQLFFIFEEKNLQNICVFDNYFVPL